MKAARFTSSLFLSSLTFVAALALFFVSGDLASAHAQTATVTALQQTSACPTSGCVTTLTATVTAGGTAVHPGLVVFCDGTAANCENGLTLGHAQLLASGTATLKLTLKAGPHVLKAVFHGTKTYGSSTSATLTATIAPNSAERATSFAGPPQANASGGGYSFSVPYFNSIGPVAPTGNMSFIDTSRNNAVLATAAVGSTSSYLEYFPTSEDVSQVPTNQLTSAVTAIAGDFNGDGIEDVAQLDAGTVLTVLLGKASGGFTPAPAYSGNTGAHGPMLVGDFNGDGKLDIAIPDAATSKVHVALGNGDGTFFFATPTTLADSPQMLSLGDFNDDGVADLLVLSSVSPAGSAVHVLLGAGDGTFTAKPPIAFGTDVVKSVAVGDFNHDGNQDLAVADSTASKILVLSGVGDGTFNATPAASISHQARYLVAGDFDGDGTSDLASGASTLAFFHGNGDLTFTQQGIEVNNVQFGAPMTTGGYDATGALEVGFLVGGFTFYDFPYVPAYHSFGNYDAFVYSQQDVGTAAIGDFNGDGLPDVLHLDTSQGTITSYNALLQNESSAVSYKKLTFDAGYHNIVAMFEGDAAHDTSVSLPTSVYGSAVDYGSGFTTSPAASINGSASLQGTSLQLTDGKPFESSSFFNTERLPWAGFQSSFDFQLGSGAGDGIAFVLQSNGPDAIGSSGGGLGYGNPPGGTGPSITNSFAIVFDTHNNQGEGSNSLRLEINGVTSPAGAVDLTPYGIDLHSGHRFNVVMTDYTNPKYISLLISDLTTKKSANLGLQGISQSTIGDMAYVGFTAGSGATSATQTIFDFTFTLASPPPPVQAYPPPTFTSGFAGATALTLNGSTINGTALQLTNGTTYQRTSTYFTKKLGPGSGFSTDFDFDLGTGAGDGFTFVIENGHIGAVGSSGGGLGYGLPLPGAVGYSVPDSTAIKFDLHNNAGEGDNSTGIYVNGASPTTPSVDIIPSGLNLHSGHIFHAHIAYTPETAVVTLTITDLTVYHVFETTFAGSTHNLQTLPFAFVGFTAGTGATPSSIKILNWTFTNVDPL